MPRTSRVTSRPVPPSHSGWVRTAAATRPSDRPGCGGRDAREGDREAERRERVHRRAAAVNAGGRDRLAGEVGDRLADGALQGVRGPRYAPRPAVGAAGREHGRVLARAVLREGARAPGRACQASRSAASRGRSGVFCRSVVEGGGGEHPADAVQVVALAGVARARQREQRALEVQARPDHRDGLQRLVRRPREDRRLPVAGGRDDVPVAVDRHGRAVVHALDEAGPDDTGEDGVAHGR